MTDLSTAEVQQHPVRIACVSDAEEQAPQASSPGDLLVSEGQSGVKRLTSTPAFSLAWAASLPVAGGGLVWYAALHCFVC